MFAIDFATFDILILNFDANHHTNSNVLDFLLRLGERIGDVSDGVGDVSSDLGGASDLGHDLLRPSLEFRGACLDLLSCLLGRAGRFAKKDRGADLEAAAGPSVARAASDAVARTRDGGVAPSLRRGRWLGSPAPICGRRASLR